MRRRGRGRGFAIMRVAAAVGLVALLAGGPARVLAAGPPYPSPVEDQAVYDEADVFDEATIASAERTDVIFRYGEEKRARAIARAIVARRQQAPITRPSEL